jgi:energy-coupling factor transporter ATP-binding protein EcfA2
MIIILNNGIIYFLEVPYEKIATENYKTQLKHEVARINAITQIREKNILANYIDNENNVPWFQKLYWAKKLEISELITSFFVEKETEPQQATLPAESWQNTQPEIESVQKIEVTPAMGWIVEIAEKTCLPLEKRSHQHLKIDGGSQSGKSTLVSLIIALISRMEGKLQINLIDPKYPKTQWMIEPSFIGYEQVGDGIHAAIAELENRKKLCLQAAKNKQQQPTFTRYLLIVDEWDNIWGNGKGYASVISKKEAEGIKGNLQRIFKEAAAYNLSLILIGQSPLATDNGFSRSSFNSATRIVLGNEALKWVQDPGFPFKGKAQALADELEEVIGNGDRVAMIAPNLGSAPFIEPIPQINLMEVLGKPQPPQQPPQQPQPTPEPQQPQVENEEMTQEQKTYIAMRDWIANRETPPTPEEVATIWEKLTGKRLQGEALAYVMEKFGL